MNSAGRGPGAPAGARRGARAGGEDLAGRGRDRIAAGPDRVGEADRGARPPGGEPQGREVGEQLEVAVAGLPARGRRPSCGAIDFDAGAGSWTGAGAVIGDVVEEVGGAELLTLEAALHVDEGEQDRVDVAGGDQGAELLGFSSSRYFGLEAWSPRRRTRAGAGRGRPRPGRSSMSEVAEGPEMSVAPAAAAAASAAIASGTVSTIWSAATTQRWRSGTRVSARRPSRGAAVEDERPGLGDREGAAGEHPVELVESVAAERGSSSIELDPGGRQAGRSHGTARLRTPLAAQRAEHLASSAGGDPADPRARSRQPARSRSIGALLERAYSRRAGASPAPDRDRGEPAVRLGSRSQDHSRAALIARARPPVAEALAGARGQVAVRVQARPGRLVAAAPRPSRAGAGRARSGARSAKVRGQAAPAPALRRPARRPLAADAGRAGAPGRRDVDLHRADLVAGAAQRRGEGQRRRAARARCSCGVRIAPIGPG